VDEIYEESKEVFLTPGHPQDGQVVFYKVGSLHSYLCSSVFSRASQPGAASCWVPAPWPCVIFVSWSCTEVARRGPGGLGLPYPGGQSDSASSRLQQHRVCWGWDLWDRHWCTCPAPWRYRILFVPVQISVDRGLKWEEAYEKSLKLTGSFDGFYLSYKVGLWALPGWHLSLEGDS